MPSYTVVSSEKKKDLNGGATVQLLTLKNTEGQEKTKIEMFLPAGQTAPTVGGSLDGTVSFDEQFKTFKFKGDRKGPYTGGGGKNFKADPAKLEVEREKNRAIASEAAHRVAVDTIRLAIETKQDPAELARQIVTVGRILFDDTIGRIK